MVAAAVRGRQLPLLARVFLRTPGWRPLVPMVAISFGLLVWAEVTGHQDAVLWLLRGSAILLAVGATYVIDDAAESLTSSSPTRLGIRRAVPVFVVLLALAVVWAGLLGYAATVSPEDLPVVDLTVELAALLALGLAFAAVFGAVGAGPGVVMAVIVAQRLPARWSLYAGAPGDSAWSSAHKRWVVLIVIAVAALVWRSRDPASRRGVLT